MKKIAFIALLAGGLLASCTPTEYEVSRETVIEAPAPLVFDQVNNHKNRDAWSPWEEMDPDMTKTYEGPESGAGAVYKWTGNDSVGTGSLEILESNPSTFIKSRLTFTAPWETSSIIEWHFVEVDGGTKAKWVSKGSLPGYLFWMGADDMDEMMGPQFEEGLAQLKTVSEEMNSSDDLPQQVLETTVAPMNYYYVDRKIPIEEMNQDLFSQGYEAIFKHLGEDAARVKEPMFAVFHEWDEENGSTHLEIAVAVDSDKRGSDQVKKGTTYQGDVVMRIFQGPYDQTAQVHEELHQYIEERELQFNGSPWESYVVGPGEDPDPGNWITEIYYPVSK